MTDPGLGGAATTFLIIGAGVVLAGFLWRRLERRRRELDRLEWRRVWRADWLVGEALVDWPGRWHELELRNGSTTALENAWLMPIDQHAALHEDERRLTFSHGVPLFGEVLS